jgi:gluconokinase
VPVCAPAHDLLSLPADESYQQRDECLGARGRVPVSRRVTPMTSVGSGPRRRAPEVVIGLDVGTSQVKASAFALDGPGPLTTAVSTQHRLRSDPDRWEQDPGEILDRVAQVLATCATRLEGAAVIGVSVAAAMHGLIGFDQTGRPVTPLVTWADGRARREARELRASETGERLYRSTGVPVHPMSPLAKLRWFARNEPATFAAVTWWGGLKDLLLQWLTGELITEMSSASATGLADLRTVSWSPDALDWAGIEADQLPPIVDPRTVLALAPAAAARTGLVAGTPVVVGAADGPLANLGAGAIEAGVAGLSVGTSAAVRLMVDTPVLDEAGTLFCYALADRVRVIGGALSNGGSVARWAAAVLGPGDGGEDPAASSVDAVLDQARRITPGSDGLVMVPYLMAPRAPLWDPDLSGAFLGLRAHHSRAHLARAAIEGVGLQLRILLDQLDGLRPVHEVRATGGVFAHPLWREVISAVLDRPVRFTSDVDGTARGAAALGLVALGRAPGLARAVTTLGDPDEPDLVQPAPDPVTVEIYRDLRAAVPGLIRQLGAVADLFTAR